MFDRVHVPVQWKASLNTSKLEFDLSFFMYPAPRPGQFFECAPGPPQLLPTVADRGTLIIAAKLLVCIVCVYSSMTVEPTDHSSPKT